MTATEAGGSSRTRAVLPVAILLIAVAAVSWAGFSWWRTRTGIKNARVVDLVHYLQFKNQGVIWEVWLEGDQLTAEIKPSAILSSGANSFMKATIPYSVLADPAKFKDLWDGLPPDKFHQTPGR